MNGLTEGRIVHYVLDQGRNIGQHRPAIVVRVWYVEHEGGIKSAPVNGLCQLQVFTDESNDDLPAVMWVTSCVFDESAAPRSWHWPEKA
jgi:hypothetical protein